LNHLVEPAGLPRALGVAATLNEIAFALSPVAASLLGGVSPVWAMAATTALGMGPMLLMPSIPEARGPQAGDPARARRRIPPTALLWLFCAVASGGAVAAVERSEEHTSELQSRENLVCRLLLEKKKRE